MKLPTVSELTLEPFAAGANKANFHSCVLGAATCSWLKIWHRFERRLWLRERQSLLEIQSSSSAGADYRLKIH
jgi:hypothetical protein